MRVITPAKVNLYLRITGRRPDGYHLLDSIMVPVSLYDELEITAEDQTERVAGQKPLIRLTCDDPTLPIDETNLAYKAAALFCKEAEVSPKIEIALRKRIPFGAGLGGGSSDAAAVLKSLNLLFSQRFTESQLCVLATRLGADVPFFILCRPARVEGVGEILSPIPVLSSRWLVVVVPPFGVSTPWAYRQFDELPSKTEPVAAELRQFTHGHWPPLSYLINDLERAVVPTYPAIQDIKERLMQKGSEKALMSGSGSSVFGIFSHRLGAERAAELLKNQGKTFVVELLAGPPLP